jgi:hypothetical protein
MTVSTVNVSAPGTETGIETATVIATGTVTGTETGIVIGATATDPK